MANIMANIIINIKTEKEYDLLLKRLDEKGYHQGTPGDLLETMRGWSSFRYDPCVRLNERMILYYDNIKYYRKSYSEIKILTVEEYFRIHDKGNNPFNLNKQVIQIIKDIVEKQQ